MLRLDTGAMSFADGAGPLFGVRLSRMERWPAPGAVLVWHRHRWGLPRPRLCCSGRYTTYTDIGIFLGKRLAKCRVIFDDQGHRSVAPCERRLGLHTLPLCCMHVWQQGSLLF